MQYLSRYAEKVYLLSRDHLVIRGWYKPHGLSGEGWDYTFEIFSRFLSQEISGGPVWGRLRFAEPDRPNMEQSADWTVSLFDGTEKETRKGISDILADTPQMFWPSFDDDNPVNIIRFETGQRQTRLEVWNFFVAQHLAGLQKELWHRYRTPGIDPLERRFYTEVFKRLRELRNRSNADNVRRAAAAITALTV